MLKNILNLAGAQKLTKNEQKEINGGRIPDLSKLCGAMTFRSIESQCLGLTSYSPIWYPATNMCSVVGHNCNGGILD